LLFDVANTVDGITGNPLEWYRRGYRAGDHSRRKLWFGRKTSATIRSKPARCTPPAAERPRSSSITPALNRHVERVGWLWAAFLPTFSDREKRQRNSNVEAVCRIVFDQYDEVAQTS
jgi:hypothetical protein